LRHHNRLAAHIQNRAVDFSLLVFEDAQSGDFFRQKGGLPVGIAMPDPQQDDQSRPDFGDCFPIDGHTPIRHTLDEGAHKVLHFVRISSRAWQHANRQAARVCK
jgi:hypothetical protein